MEVSANRCLSATLLLKNVLQSLPDVGYVTCQEVRSILDKELNPPLRRF